MQDNLNLIFRRNRNKIEFSSYRVEKYIFQKAFKNHDVSKAINSNFTHCYTTISKTLSEPLFTFWEIGNGNW